MIANCKLCKHNNPACSIDGTCYECVKGIENHFEQRVVHKLKIMPKYYNDIVSGEKSFELRKNDRDYQVGDTLCLREYDGEYTGREKYFVIKYILKDCPEYGLMDGYCILGL